MKYLALLLLAGCLHVTVDPVPVVIEYRLKPVDLLERDAGTTP